MDELSRARESVERLRHRAEPLWAFATMLDDLDIIEAALLAAKPSLSAQLTIQSQAVHINELREKLDAAERDAALLRGEVENYAANALMAANTTKYAAERLLENIGARDV